MNASEMARALLLTIAPETALGLPSSHAGQQTVIKGAKRFNVIAAGRRWGKNTLAEGQIILPALQGKPVAWFSPTYKTLAEDWRRLSEILRPVVRDKSEQEQRMELVTGGVVEMWSLDKPESALGRAYRRVVIDEAATVNKLLYCWQQIIRPMLTDYSGDAWFISTPTRGNGDITSGATARFSNPSLRIPRELLETRSRDAEVATGDPIRYGAATFEARDIRSSLLSTRSTAISVPQLIEMGS